MPCGLSQVPSTEALSGLNLRSHIRARTTLTHTQRILLVPHSPDTSTYPSLVFTISSSGLKLCTLTHTFQGSPGKGGGLLPSAGTPNLFVAVGPRGTMPDLRVPGQAEDSRGKAHSGQGAVKSSGKGSMPKPSSRRREESGESRKGSRRRRLG